MDTVFAHSGSINPTSENPINEQEVPMACNANALENDNPNQEVCMTNDNTIATSDNAIDCTQEACMINFDDTTADAPVDAPADESQLKASMTGGLAHQIQAAHWMLHRYRHMGAMAAHASAGSNPGQGRVLALLKKSADGKLAQRDMAYLLGIRQQSLSELLGKLERAGLITRTPSETDRRTTVVSLTEAGSAKVALPSECDCTDAFDCLTEEERAQLLDMLRRVNTSLAQKVGSMRGPKPHGPRGTKGPRGPQGPCGAEGFGPRNFKTGGCDGEHVPGDEGCRKHHHRDECWEHRPERGHHCHGHHHGPHDPRMMHGCGPKPFHSPHCGPKFGPRFAPEFGSPQFGPEFDGPCWGGPKQFHGPHHGPKHHHGPHHGPHMGRPFGPWNPAW